MLNYADHHRELEEDIKKILSDYQRSFSNKENLEIKEFLQAGEFWLALESLVACFITSELELSAETVLKIKQISESMGVYDDEAVARLVSEYVDTDRRLVM